MQVGIAGAGAIAMGYAALLERSGHAATLWSPSGAGTRALREGAPLRVTGAIEGTFHPRVADDAAELARNDVVVLALPAYGHRLVLDRLAPHLESRHRVVISGHLSFAALHLARALAARGLRIPIAAWSTTVLTCKAQPGGEFRIGTIRRQVDMAALPAALSDEALSVCVDLFGDRFALKDDILTIALSNLNPQDHMGIALCNLTRIERGETWGQNTHTTPAVGKLLEAIDGERVQVAAAFGKSVRTTFDHHRLSYDVTGPSVAAMATTMAERGSDPLGPKTLQTRYVLEDVPYGLVPTVHLARLAGVSVPLHESGIRLLGGCYGRDFEADNDLLETVTRHDRDELTRIVVDGYPIRGRSAA